MTAFNAAFENSESSMASNIFIVLSSLEKVRSVRDGLTVM
jgi:hypothetical protein